MEEVPIYRWNGKYFGFICRGYFFDAKGNYLGWVDEDNKVWRSNGEFLGEIVDKNYILRRIDMISPLSKIPKIPPISPIPPIPKPNRIGRAAIPGWEDALDDYK